MKTEAKAQGKHNRRHLEDRNGSIMRVWKDIMKTEAKA